MRPVNNHPACLLSSRGKVDIGNESKKATKQQAKVAKPTLTEAFVVSPTLVKVESEPVRAVVTQSFELLSRDKVVIDLVDNDEDEIVDEDEDSDSEPSGWWRDVAKEVGIDKLNAATSSNKVVMFFHILAQACKLDEKVVVFSQCLKVCMLFDSYTMLSSNHRQCCSLTLLFTDA